MRNEYKDKSVKIKKYGLDLTLNNDNFSRQTVSQQEFEKNYNNRYSYLYVYLKNYLECFRIYDELIDKIETFEMIINKRYKDTRKSIILRPYGIKIAHMGSPVGLDKLSSGELNDFTMFFDLVFRTEKNSLIIIDEPEISLHVSWQETFIDDVLKCISGKECQIIISTHSPDLISFHNDAIINLASDCLKISEIGDSNE